MQETVQQPQVKRPKSIRQVRQMRKRQPKLVEGPKKTLIVKGNKTSPITTHFMKSIVPDAVIQRAIKREHSTYFSRRHDTHPFETTQEIEKYCRGADCSLFLFGSNSKKRPNNIVIGRLYENQVLDMVEFGLTTEEEEVCAISSDVPSNCRPFVIFQGDKWETEETHGKLRNLLQDFFVENVKVEELEVNNAIRLVVCFSAIGDRIYMRTYEVSISGSNILDMDGDMDIGEVAPKVDMVLRRSKFADSDQWKEAVKQPKPATKRDQRNVSRDEVGDKRGRVYIDNQNLEVLPLKKRKHLVKKDKMQRKLEEKQARLEEFAG